MKYTKVYDHESHGKHLRNKEAFLLQLFLIEGSTLLLGLFGKSQMDPKAESCSCSNPGIGRGYHKNLRLLRSYSISLLIECGLSNVDV